MSGAPLRVAIIGSGIAGLAAAHAPHGLADVMLFEAGTECAAQERPQEQAARRASAQDRK